MGCSSTGLPKDQYEESSNISQELCIAYAYLWSQTPVKYWPAVMDGNQIYNILPLNQVRKTVRGVRQRSIIFHYIKRWRDWNGDFKVSFIRRIYFRRSYFSL